MSRYLLVRLGSLGDVIHAIPAAAALRAHAPDARIDWLVDPRYAGVVRMVRGVDHVIAVDPRESKAELLSTIRGLRRVGYDAAFDVQGLIKSAVLTRLAGARQTFGFPRAHLREALARALYTDMPDVGTAVHVVHKALAMVAAVGVPLREPSFPLTIPASAAAVEVTARHPSGFALLNPGAAWPNKQWLAARFGALASRIRADHGLPSVVIWGPGERPHAEAVAAASSGAAEVAPQTAVTDLFGLAKAARVVVSGDTGPLHIAGAVGAPLVAIFGPTITERNGPWAPRDLTVARTAECQCLYQRECRLA
ncbi:MAG TPA: glycosyltransferase family 9 protein, partial [Vicinamibacterales bacterium]